MNLYVDIIFGALKVALFGCPLPLTHYSSLITENATTF